MWHEYSFHKKKETLLLQLCDNFTGTLSVLIIIIMVKEMKDSTKY